MRTWKRSSWAQILSTFLAATIAAACRGGSSSDDGASGRRAAGLTGAPPSAPTGASGTPADEDQGDFANPTTNTGAFVHRIPIDVPPGVGAMTPDVALAYSSQGGVGTAGVGWDIPLPLITINQADGTRPVTVEDDIMRYPVGTPVERYASNFGVIAELREAGDYVTAVKSYLFTAHNDSRVEPIGDDTGFPEHTGEKAAWKVTTRDGTAYRYGYLDDASLWRDEGTGNKAKVGWLLDQVEDRHGNRMHYYYEEYPGNQDTLRQPVLRAIEYGVPASIQNTPERMVVLFDYIPSPWKRTSYALGTRTDFAYLLKRVCTFAKTAVVAGTTPGGHRTWTVPGADQTQPTDDFTKTGCTELTYQFEQPSEYAAGYTGRPLLVEVHKEARDGTSLPPWKFSYTHQATRWQDVYQASIDAGGTNWGMPDQMSLERSTLDVETQSLDMNGDSLVDLVEGKTDGTVGVRLARPGVGGVEYDETSWTHPLATHATPVELTVTDLDLSGESDNSDVWWHFTATVAWEIGAGLGYAHPLIAAPAVISDLWNHSGNDGNWNEGEPTSLPLGGLRFLHKSFVGPAPSVGMRNLVDRAQTIDQLETFGSFRDRIKHEANFDTSSSDGEDAGDDVELDMCWGVGNGPSNGRLGADLQCFDEPGSRFFAAVGVTDGMERGYASELWTEQDMDGDGIVDLVFASPVWVRDDNGNVRSMASDNDWLVARGIGSGWEAPRPWPVPSKTPDLPEVGQVHGTPLLGVTVSDSELRSNRTWGGGANLGVGITGWSVSANIVTPGGAVGLPGIGAGWGGSIDWGGVATGAAVTTAFNVAYFAGASQRALSAAARSVQTAEAAFNPLSLFPSIGIGMNWTNKGPYYVLDLWFLGQVAIHLGLDPTLSRTYGYQGMADVTGDGRPDLVSAKFETPLGLVNPTTQWLVYRNTGDGFEQPFVMRFATAPKTAAAADLGVSVDITSMSRSTTSNYADTLAWHPVEWDTFPIGSVEQDWGMADLNVDGKPDLVDSTPQSCHTANGTYEQCWTVYFNLGQEFSPPIEWHFAGNWQTQHGPACSAVYAFPRLSRSVYGQTSEEQGDEERIVQGRQVQNVGDVNGDNLPDFIYEMPAPVNDTDGYCDYINPSTNFHDAEEISERVGPYRLHRKLLVRLNTGNGFGPPIDWVATNGYALSGVVVVGEGDRPTDATSHAALGVGDFNGDGTPDVGVRADGDWYNLDGNVEINRLYKLGEANVDVLETATIPNGGRLEVSYSYQKPDAHLAGGQWVASSVRMVDLDAGRLDVTRRFFYEGGRYDRDRRVFQGFERVYQVTDGADGYTLSRYYQTPGFEGQLYCRAVRRLEDAAAVVDSLAAERADAWAETPLGDHRPGWVPPVAIGDADHADELSGGPALLTDREDGLNDPPEGNDSSYGEPPTDPPSEDPAIEEEEEDRQDNEEASEPEVETPEWPPLESTDVTQFATDLPPVDVFVPGAVPWSPEDAPGAPPWWETPVHDDDCIPGIGEQGLFFCDPSTIDLNQLACGDQDDPGTLVREEFSIPGDFSTIPEIHNVRPRVGSMRLYDAAGGNPLVTASDLTYDEFGNVTLARDLGDLANPADDATTETTYQAPNDSKHVIDKPCEVHVKDSAGATLSRTRFGWDGAGLFSCASSVSVGDLTAVQQQVDAATAATEGFEYSDEGLVTSHTDARGNITTTAYHPVFPWFPLSESRAVVNANGPTTLTSETHWLGVDQSSLTHFGLVGEDVDPAGAVTRRTYDAFDRPLGLVRPGDSNGNPTESWAYHEWNGDPADRTRIEHTRRFTSNLSVTDFTFQDGFGLVERVEGPPPDNMDGCVAGCVAVAREVTYDADGRVIEQALPHFSNGAAEPELVATTYDLIGRVTAVTGPSGARTMTAYDRDLTSVVDPDGFTAVTRSDARGNPIGVYRYTDGGETLYSGIESTYRADGKLAAMVDSGGNQWSFGYDYLGRQTAVSDPNTGARSVVYDGNGNPAIVTDERYGAPLRMASGMAYDALNRPILREVRLGTTVNGTVLQGGTTSERTVSWYDVDPATFPGSALSCGGNNNRGRLSRVVQWLNLGTVLTEVSRKEYCYDERGRVTHLAHTIVGNTYQFEYKYGSADQLMLTEYSDGDVVTNEYDSSGRLAASSNAAGPLLAESRVRADGLPVKRVFGAGTLKQRFCYQPGASGVELARVAVGGAGLSVACANPGPAPSAVWDVAYERTAAGRIQRREETFVRPGSGTEDHLTEYEYDGVARLFAETADGTTTSFEYDPLDNLVGMDGQVQEFGASGRATRLAGPNAILEGAGGQTFAYDKAGNALAMTSGGVNYGFGRAFDGQPLVVTVNGIPNSATYYYDESGARVYRAKGGAGTLYAGPYHDDGVTPRTQYPGIGVKVGSAQYFTVGDQVDSNALTFDADGAVVQYTRYEPHGGIREDAAFDPDPNDGVTPLQTDFLYNGKERDETFGADDDVYDFGPRMYMADVGTWLTPDSTYNDGPNRYAFVQGDPINASDPTGEGGYRGWGHHIVVQELYRPGGVDDLVNWSPEVIKVFDQWTSGPLSGHGFSVDHAAYNRAVIAEAEIFGREYLGKVSTIEWTPEDAADFVAHIHMSQKPEINGFLNKVAAQIGPLTPNAARNMRTAMNLGDRFKARWMLAVRNTKGLGPLAVGLGALSYWAYLDEASGNYLFAAENFGMDMALDWGTWGLLTPSQLAKDDLSFQMENYAERWEAWQNEEFPQCAP